MIFQTVLSLRHWFYVQAHRDTVPAEFAATISLEAHQKAADYTVTKVRFGILESFVDAGVLLLLTIGGGVMFVDALVTRFSDVIGSAGYMRGLALVVGVMILSSLISIPFDLYRTFNIEARYGFNKITLKLYVLDALKGLVLSAVIGVPSEQWGETPAACNSSSTRRSSSRASTPRNRSRPMPPHR